MEKVKSIKSIKSIRRLKNFFDTWVLAKDTPQGGEPQGGELHIITPDGKTLISMSIATKADAAKAKKLTLLALSDGELTENTSIKKY